MSTPFRQSLLALSVTLALGAAAQSNVLTAVKADSPPTVDGVANDAAWAKASPITIKLGGGRGFEGGKTTVTLKAVYTVDTLYMLVVYDDPTLSLRRSPFQKQADGTWKKLSDPDDKGGDNNLYYEDKWAMIWNIGNTMKSFDKLGCMATCHAGEPGKPYGNKYTAEAGELGDIWHSKSVRGGYSIGQIDNQYLDHTRFDKDKSPGAGRKSDAKTGGGYADIKLVNGKPEFMAKDARPANKGGTYWLKDEDKVPFDDAKFVAGDEVSSILVSKFTGERGNLSSGAKWADGKWTHEVARRLVTGSPNDVQFKDLGGSYTFGFAAFDNAQVRHAWHNGSAVLKFAN